MKNIFMTLLLLMGTMVSALNLKSVVIIGPPVEDRKEIWQDEANVIVWLDADNIVYAGQNFVKCYNLAKQLERWSRNIHIRNYQLTSGKGNIFLIDDDGIVHILNGSTGKTVKQLDGNRSELTDPFFDKTVKQCDREDVTTIIVPEYLFPQQIAWVPNKNAILMATYSDNYGENSILLDGQSFQLLSKIKSEGFLTTMKPTQDGSMILTLSRKNNIRIWSIDKAQEIFKMGQDKVSACDEPFMSNAMFDGNNTLIYSIDNSWATGVVSVYDIQQKKETASFNSRNGHLKMDVDFAASRIALTGTSKNITLVDFKGCMLAECKNAAADRIIAVKFSPDGHHLAIGSWDKTVRIFEIKEKVSNN